MAAPDRRWLPLAAALALGVGVCAAVWAAAGTRAALLALSRPYLDLRMLREMAVPLGEPAAARRLYEQAPAARGTAADFLRAARPEWAALVQKETVSPSGPGWSVRQAMVQADGVPMADVAALLEAAESQRPPWRVAELTVEAAGAEALARAALVLERLERAGP